jgi:hypothetical protein
MKQRGVFTRGVEDAGGVCIDSGCVFARRVAAVEGLAAVDM